jgi:AcrR family transcriptional regulator
MEMNHGLSIVFMSDPVSAPASRSRSGSPGRRRRKKQRTRREIYRAAMACFGEQGFEAVSIDRICEAADVARGTFFLHFPSKGALLRELDRQLAEELAGQLAEPRGSALAEYRTLVDRFAEDWPRRPGLRADLLGAVLREGLATPRGDGGSPDLRQRVEEIVRRGQQRGELRRNVSPRLAAGLFLATAAALLSGGIYADGEATPEQLRNELLHVLLHGVAESKPRLKWGPRPSGA